MSSIPFFDIFGLQNYTIKSSSANTFHYSLFTIHYSLFTLHHPAHTWGTAHRHSRLFLRLVYNQTLGGQEHTSDRSSVLQSHTSHLGGIDHTSLTQILVDIGTGIETEVALTLANLLNHHSTLGTAIDGNLAQGLLDGTADDVDTGLLVGIVTLQVSQRLLGTDVCGTTTGNHAFLDGSTGSAESIVNAILLLLHLHLRVGTDIEHSDATGQLGQTLLQLLLVVGAGGGTTYIRAQEALKNVKGDNADEQTGINIICRAIEEPLRQIVTNAGGEGAVVVQKVREGKGDFGYNARLDKYEDLREAGVIDPAKVARVALENAASIAGMFLTTECIICDKPEKEPAMPMGGAPGMGGMM